MCCRIFILCEHSLFYDKVSKTKNNALDLVKKLNENKEDNRIHPADVPNVYLAFKKFNHVIFMKLII